MVSDIMNLCLKNEAWAVSFNQSKVNQSLNIFQLHVNHLNIITKDQVFVCVIILFH